MSYIDDHPRLIAATPDRTWRALLSVLGQSTSSALPRLLVSAWGLEQPARHGDWRAPAVGDTIPGFEVAEIDPPRVLTLRGRHRFAHYQLRFTVEPLLGDGVELHARTHASFPSLLGGVYRTLVIGTRGHVVATRWLLAQVARRAERST